MPAPAVPSTCWTNPRPARLRSTASPPWPTISTSTGGELVEHYPPQQLLLQRVDHFRRIPNLSLSSLCASCCEGRFRDVADVSKDLFGVVQRPDDSFTARSLPRKGQPVAGRC